MRGKGEGTRAAARRNLVQLETRNCGRRCALFKRAFRNGSIGACRRQTPHPVPLPQGERGLCPDAVRQFARCVNPLPLSRGRHVRKGKDESQIEKLGLSLASANSSKPDLCFTRAGLASCKPIGSFPAAAVRHNRASPRRRPRARLQSHFGMKAAGQSSWPMLAGSSASMLGRGVARMILFSRRGEPELSPVVTRTRSCFPLLALAQSTHVLFWPSSE